MDICDQFIIGNSQLMVRLRELIRQVAKFDLSTVIRGETGVGKETVAKAVHLSSHRRDKPFAIVNCSVTPDTLFESHLFGYEKGSSGGIGKIKRGLLEKADEGTIVFNEIGNMPLSAQELLYQFLNDSQFVRLGGKSSTEINVRVVVTTSDDLEEAVRMGRLREDLYYRLSTIEIFVPPLRERIEDIELLVDYFKKKSADIGSSFEIDHQLRDDLRQYSWPGNIRELRNFVEGALLLEDRSIVQEKIRGGEPAEFDRLKPRSRSSYIMRSIEFSPEVYQSGMSILTYFGTVIRKKYPDKKVRVRIEQDESKVRMIIETPEGEKEKIEKTMDQYQQVVRGKIALDSFFDTEADVSELRQHLNIAKAQLEARERLLRFKEGELERTTQRLELSGEAGR